MESEEIQIDETAAIGYIDDAAHDKLKAEHKQKYLHTVLTFDDDEKVHVTYFKKPTLENLQILASYAKKGEEFRGLETLFNTCRVAGSQEVVTDDEMRVSAFKALAQIFKRREAIVKKR